MLTDTIPSRNVICMSSNYSPPHFEKWGEQSEGSRGDLSNKISPNPSLSKRRGLNNYYELTAMLIGNLISESL